MKFLSTTLNTALLTLLVVFSSMVTAEKNPEVLLKTDMGEIYIELYPKEAPVTVANFLKYVDNHFYDGVIFHRVLPGFMIQSGGFSFDYVEKETRETIINESDNGLDNSCGTLAMARLGGDVDSASAQFFINLNKNTHLNSREKNDGYAVFGKVIRGMRIAEAISEQRRGKHSGKFADAPNIPLRIIKAKRVKNTKRFKTKCAAQAR